MNYRGSPIFNRAVHNHYDDYFFAPNRNVTPTLNVVE